jgi:hypothetical protein
VEQARAKLAALRAQAAERKAARESDKAKPEPGGDGAA